MTDLQKEFQTSFRDAMASCAAGVHVITTEGSAGRYGITMTAVTPVTDEPPTVMLCINRKARIIPILSENGTLDFQDLANQACILRPSLTGILTRLEKAGLVVRLKPSNDQRRVFLKLTAEGEKLYEEIGEEVDERYDAIEEVLSREKMMLLKDLLAELAQIEDLLNS